MKFSNVLHKAFNLLQAKPLTGGLEISDAAIRFVFWGGTRWQVVSVRLAPGVIVAGRLQDRGGLLDALYTLRGRLLGEKHARGKKRINVILSLSSARVFTQVFNLPKIEGSSLENAISLNVRMASPTSEEETYSGWQLVGEQENEMRLEVLSVFLEREMIDAFTEVLREASFVPMAAESSALSLARIIRKSAVANIEKPIIVVAVNASGIDIMILRHGHLHFDYFNSWKEIQGSDSTITTEQFTSAIVQNFKKVLNFYNTHWNDRIDQVLVTAGGMQDRIVELIRKNFELPTSSLALNTTPPLTAEWYPALGSALRAQMPRREDNEASLLSINAREEFRREQTLEFVRFWRVLAPASMLVLLLVMGGADMFMRRLNAVTQQRIEQTAGAELSTAEELFQEADEFNRLVGYIEKANNTYAPKSPKLETVLSIVNSRDVTITSISFPRTTAEPISLQGTAPTQGAVVAFKDAMVADDDIAEVNLPLTAIQEGEDGYIFSMTFSIASLSAE